MKNIMDRLKRIEAISTIKSDLQSTDTSIHFTREKHNNISMNLNFYGLDNITIINIVKTSLKDAKHMAESCLGMVVQTDINAKASF